MRKWNAMVDIERQPVEQVASKALAEVGLK
jgi:hypothetical protein